MIAKSSSTKNTSNKNTTTKRQKIKALQTNELNKLPQQPRIKSSEQRAKIDIVQSGLGGYNKKPQELLNPVLDLDSPEIKFGRSLASSDAVGRHKAVNKLKFYLKARSDITNEDGGFSELDLMKLWKGLWYCLYMADKVPVQDELSKRIADLIWCLEGTLEEDEYAGKFYLSIIGAEDEFANKEEEMEDDEKDMDDVDDDSDDSVEMEVVKNTLSKVNEVSDEEDNDSSVDDKKTDCCDKKMDCSDGEDGDQPAYLVRHCRGAHLASLFVRTFFATVRREWGNMDKYRVDKFYTLMRLMMGEVYKYMAKRHWDYGITRLFNDHLHDEILSQIPNGIRYHIIDLAIDQLAMVNAKFSILPLTETTFVEVLEPFFGLVQSEKNATVQSRVVEGIFKKFLLQYSVVGDKALEEKNETETEDEEDLTFDNVHVGSISELIFSIASDEETRDRYRESLYELHKMYEKRIKEVGKDVDIDAGDPESDDYDMEKEEDKMEEEETPPEPTVETKTTQSTKKAKKKKSKKEDSSSKSKIEEASDNEPKKEQVKSSKKRKKTLEDKTKEETPMKTSKKAKDTNKEVSVDDEKAKDVDADKDNKKTKDTNKEVSVDEEKAKEDGATGTESAKKKRKKKKKKAKDEVIMISTSDQVEAMKASSSFADEEEKTSKKSNEKSKKKKKVTAYKHDMDDANDDDDSHDETEKNRRVSFGKVNYSKSYKASMKGLKTMEHPNTALRTPEKGILLKKDSLESKTEDTVKSKKRRKKNKKVSN